MLGNGRPFILELLAPKVLTVDLAELEAENDALDQELAALEDMNVSCYLTCHSNAMVIFPLSEALIGMIIFMASTSTYG